MKVNYFNYLDGKKLKNKKIFIINVFLNPYKGVKSHNIYIMYLTVYYFQS